MANSGMVVTRFTVGEHSSSRSLFGLRKAQIVGEAISLSVGFAALMGLKSAAGIVAFAAAAVVSSVAFLMGFRGQTLDQLLLALIAHARVVSGVRKGAYRNDIFGFSKPPEEKSFVLSADKSRRPRISLSRHRRSGSNVVSGYPGPQLRRLWEVPLTDGAALGIAKERHGKRGVVGFELFDEGFGMKDPQDQAFSASVFGTMLGRISSMSNRVESLAIVYLIDPEAGKSSILESSGWADDTKALYSEVSCRRVERRCYLVLRTLDTSLGEHECSEIVSFVSGLGLSYEPLDAANLAELFAFGTGERPERGVLSIRSCWSHILIGERFAKVFEVSELPTGEVSPDFLVPFLASLDCQSLLGFRFKVIDGRFALRKVRSRRSGITADAGVRSLLGFLSRSSEARVISSLEVQEVDLDLGYVMFSVIGHVAVFAGSLAELKEAAKAAAAKAEKSGLVLECVYGKQQQAYRELFGASV